MQPFWVTNLTHLSYLSKLFELFGFLPQIELPVTVGAYLLQVPAFDHIWHTVLDWLWPATQQLRDSAVAGKAAITSTESLHVGKD